MRETVNDLSEMTQCYHEELVSAVSVLFDKKELKCMRKIANIYQTDHLFHINLIEHKTVVPETT